MILKPVLGFSINNGIIKFKIFSIRNKEFIPQRCLSWRSPGSCGRVNVDSRGW